MLDEEGYIREMRMMFRMTKWEQPALAAGNAMKFAQPGMLGGVTSSAEAPAEGPARGLAMPRHPHNGAEPRPPGGTRLP